MPIGIFGGTFNPIHFGHLRTALEVAEKFGLKEAVFVPSSIPPHKDQKEIADPMDRLKMVNLAVTGNPLFSVSEVEIYRKGKSYSIDTIRALKEKTGEEPLVFILGADAFVEIETWRRCKEIFGECDFIVHSRPRGPKIGRECIPEGLKDAFKKKANEPEYVHSSGRTLTFTEVTELDISATKIRAMIREGRSTRYLLPRRVGEYIYENGLYK